MNYRLDLRPQVSADIASAADWYDAQQPGLGAQFVHAIRDRIDQLLQDPLRSRIRDRARRARWVLPPRFPYRIIYRVTGDVVLVIAVIHAARHERNWKKRG